jgi:hypothetical protein
VGLAALGLSVSAATAVYIVAEILEVFGKPMHPVGFVLMVVVMAIGLWLPALAAIAGLIGSLQLARGRRGARLLFWIALMATVAPVALLAAASVRSGVWDAGLTFGLLGLLAAYGLLTWASMRMAKRGDLR